MSHIRTNKVQSVVAEMCNNSCVCLAVPVMSDRHATYVTAAPDFSPGDKEPTSTAVSHTAGFLGVCRVLAALLGAATSPETTSGGGGTGYGVARGLMPGSPRLCQVFGLTNHSNAGTLYSASEASFRHLKQRLRSTAAERQQHCSSYFVAGHPLLGRAG